MSLGFLLAGLAALSGICLDSHWVIRCWTLTDAGACCCLPGRASAEVAASSLAAAAALAAGIASLALPGT